MAPPDRNRFRGCFMCSKCLLFELLNQLPVFLEMVAHLLTKRLAQNKISRKIDIKAEF